MNRRSFLRNSALALFGFAVLPPAQTYQRVWRATREVMPWDEGPYRCIMSRPIEYRANGIGIYEMLKQQFPVPNGPGVDLLNFFDEVQAVRKVNTNPEVIEVFTDMEGVRYLNNYA